MTEVVEFHDPTGQNSWRIIDGTILEQWGVRSAVVQSHTIVFAEKQYADTLYQVQAACPVTRRWPNVLAETTGQCLIRIQGDNGSSSTGAIVWFTKGQWDGVS